MPRPSPLQNRVDPTGAIVAENSRGMFMGNRGILHQGYRLGAARWRHRNWVCCRTAFRGRKRELMSPGHYTELFFLDEAVALAAGHRPCAECRREDYNRFKAAWARAHPAGPAFGGADGAEKLTAPMIDKALHRARVQPRSRQHIRHQTALNHLPDGVMILQNDVPWLILGNKLYPFRPQGYASPTTRPDDAVLVTVLTPAPSVAVLAAGYRPKLHPSAV